MPLPVDECSGSEAGDCSKLTNDNTVSFQTSCRGLAATHRRMERLLNSTERRSNDLHARLDALLSRYEHRLAGIAGETKELESTSSSIQRLSKPITGTERRPSSRQAWSSSDNSQVPVVWRTDLNIPGTADSDDSVADIPSIPLSPNIGEVHPVKGAPELLPTEDSRHWDDSDEDEEEAKEEKETMDDGSRAQSFAKKIGSSNLFRTFTSFEEGDATKRRRSAKPSEALQHMKDEFEVANRQQSHMAKRTKHMMESEEGKAWRRTLRKFVASRGFDLGVTCLIISCGAVVGYETDWAMRNPDETSPEVFRDLNRIASALFALELIVRVLAEGGYFVSLVNPNIGWNLFDVILVLLSTVEELVGSMYAVNFTDLLRMVRLLRTAKVLRVIRTVRFFKDLRVMVNGIMSSAKSLLWALILLMLVMFVYGVIVMQLLLPHIVGIEALSPDEVDFTNTNGDEHERIMAWLIKKHYGTIGRSVFTLFKAVSGGIDWSDAAAPLGEVSWFVEYAFAGYIFFTVFCCLNIVTGIFVDNAKEIRIADEEAMCHEALAQRRRWVREVVQLFARVGGAKLNDTLAFEKFKENLSDIKVRTLFSSLGVNIDMYTPRELFELFDYDEGGDVDQEEFAAGIQRLNGQARSIDLFKLRRDTRKAVRTLNKKMEAMSKVCSQLQTKLPNMSGEVAENGTAGDGDAHRPLPSTESVPSVLDEV